eukprot:Tbor_TRINITY_DN5970_c0_g1::TRINITY_DN5970_c0_g1_i1::g.18575::m.18575
MNQKTPQKYSKKCCGLLSVRIMIVLMCTVLIIFATTATFIVTFYFSFTAANNVAAAHVSGITKKTKGDVESYIKHPLSIVIGLQFTFAKGTHLLPQDEQSENPMWFKAHWDNYVAAMHSSDFKYMYATMGFEDGTGVYCNNMINSWFKCHHIRCGNRSISDRSESTTELIHIFSRSDFSFVREEVMITNYDPRTRSWYNLVPHTPGAIRWSSVFLSITPTVVPTVGVSAVVFNDTGTMLGVISIGIALPDLNQFVNSVATTHGSVSILIDNEDILLASSHNVPCVTYRDIDTSYNDVVPYNCLKSDIKNGASNSVFVCRETIFSYPYLPLRELKSSNPKLISEGTDGESQTMTLDNSVYFVAAARIMTPIADGMQWRIILFLPESYVIDDIIEAWNLAICISICIIIVAVIVSFFFFTLLLRPLNVVAEDMYRVASLQDMREVADESPGPTDDIDQLKKKTKDLSLLSEIATLQFAFNTMRTELRNIKGYLPESVLAQLYGSNELSDEGDINDMQSESMICSSFNSQSDKDVPSNIDSDSVSISSMRLSSLRRKRDLQNRTLNTVLSISNRRVTIMSLNITGYHAILGAYDDEKITRIHSELVSVISSACAEHRGVMDGFQGDHFLVSFNAVTSVGNHALLAARTAYTACRAVETMPTPLTMTAGLASDSAIVGNMGDNTIKRFTVLGYVVSTAVTLERLAKRYRASCRVLAGGVAITDVENFFDVLTVDAAVLPISTTSAGWRARIAAIMSPKSTTSDEWMYELQEGSVKSSYGDANNAFTLFLDGNQTGEVRRIVELVLDGNHDPDSTSVGEALKKLIDEPGVDGKRYANTMPDFYCQCVLPKGSTAVKSMLYGSQNQLSPLPNEKRHRRSVSINSNGLSATCDPFLLNESCSWELF